MTTVLITGANRGIGFELAQLYARRADHQVLACCRSPETAQGLQDLQTETGQVELKTLNVTDLAAIDSLALLLAGRPIDILISNAGIFGKNPPATTGFQEQRFGSSDFEADWIAPYRVNVIASMALAEAFAAHLEASALKKFIVISSEVASITEAKGHMFGYSASKAAANMTARNLAVALRPRGIIVNPIHPGYARTDMSGPQAAIDPVDGAKGVLARIDDMSLERSGDFLSYDGRSIPW